MGTAARPTAARRDYGDDIGDGHKDDSLRTIFPGARPPRFLSVHSSSLTPSHCLFLVSSHYFSSHVLHSYGLYSACFSIIFPGARPPRFSSPREEAVFNLGRGNKASTGAD